MLRERLARDGELLRRDAEAVLQLPALLRGLRLRVRQLRRVELARPEHLHLEHRAHLALEGAARAAQLGRLVGRLRGSLAVRLELLQRAGELRRERGVLRLDLPEPAGQVLLHAAVVAAAEAEAEVRQLLK